MDIVFYCPECNQKIEAPEVYANREILCPTCKKTIVVPKEENIQPQEMKINKENNKDTISKIEISPKNEFNPIVYTLLGIFLNNSAPIVKSPFSFPYKCPSIYQSPFRDS